MQTYRLNNGVEIPKIGFGTYKAALKDDAAIQMALEQGYRHLDTAAFYENEEAVSRAIKAVGVSRKELFLTSKVWRENLGYDKTMKSFEDSLKRLDTDYLDLFLIHWPKENLVTDEWKTLDAESWRALEELYTGGKIRAIGVSNFLPQHLLNLMETAKVLPMVNQIEFHPGYTQWPVVDFCRKNQIQVSAWSPISRGRVFKEPLLIELSKKYQKSLAQICIRFALQCGVLPLPKASSKERIQENKDVFDFELSKEDVYRLLTLPQMGWSGEHPDRERVAPD